MEALLASPAVQAIVPVLVVVLVACLILKVAKGCLKTVIAVLLIAVAIIYVIPNFL